MRKIETVLSPLLFDLVEVPDSKIIVVIDSLRATSTITNILHNGAHSVRAVSSIEYAAELKDQGYLVGGERGGQNVPGFDFGNSPLEYSSELVKDRDIVLTTTNGTRCVEMASMANELLLGSFLSIDCLTNYLLRSEKDLVLFCAGWKERVNLEDSLFAGAVASKLQAEFELDDPSELLRFSYEEQGSSLLNKLRLSNHFNRLSGFGNEADVRFCCQLNSHTVIPRFENGVFIKA